MNTDPENSRGPELLPEPVSGHCFRCGYDLRGQTFESRCPECGLEYAVGYHEAFRERPRPLHLLWTFGWPILVFASCPGCVIALAPGPLIMNSGIPIATMASFLIGINALTAAARLIDRFGRPDIPDVSFHRRLGRAGGLAVVLFYLCGVVPLLCFVGFILLAVAAQHAMFR